MEKLDRIYEFIRSEISDRGIPPTIREIGKRFGISSTNGVRYFLDRLEAEGMIERRNWTARGIKLARTYADDAPRSSASALGPVRRVPILGRVPAGRPLLSEENLEGTILLDANLARGYEVFAVKVKGDSMIEAGINDGDIAVVKKNLEPGPGDIVVALLDDEVTLKRLAKRGRDFILKPENPAYSEINLSAMSDKDIRMLGTVIAVVRKY
ncbi:MAG: transcriptional repressor LexA [bacterium]